MNIGAVAKFRGNRVHKHEFSAFVQLSGSSPIPAALGDGVVGMKAFGMDDGDLEATYRRVALEHQV